MVLEEEMFSGGKRVGRKGEGNVWGEVQRTG
jgi:hypothetical protein